MATIFVVELFTPASGLLHTCCQYLFNINPFTSVFSRFAIVVQCKILKFRRPGALFHSFSWSFIGSEEPFTSDDFSV